MQLMGMSDRAQIPSIFSHRSSYGTPTYSILTCVIVVMSIMPLSFGLIVELANFSYCLSVTVEFMAFVKLQVIRGGETFGSLKCFLLSMSIINLFALRFLRSFKKA